jgi:hypothetical protein
MATALKNLIKDINNIDVEDIVSSWTWCLKDLNNVVLVSAIGDMFLVGEDKQIFWLDTSAASVTRIANTITEFERLLTIEENIEQWFLASAVEELIQNGKSLKENEVFSFKILPTLGGAYSADNMEVTDISVHFNITGQLQEQIKDLPPGTKIGKINLKH